MSITATSPCPPKIVFVTDAGLLRQTAFTMWGLLRHISVTPEIHFWGSGLNGAAWRALADVAATRPGTALLTRDLDAASLQVTRLPTDYLSAATMGRLLIPGQIGGRVLYIDGDCQVCGDVAPLFNMGMQGRPLAAVRDYIISKLLVRKAALSPKERARLEDVLAFMAPEQYFNAGVLMFDCDAIRQEAGLLAALEDLAAASDAKWGDQDHLNRLFAARTLLLNPTYNSSWARTGRHQKYIHRLGGAITEVQPLRNTILHFHGSDKPWKSAPKSFWRQKSRAASAYRRQAALFDRSFPELAFLRPAA